MPARRAAVLAAGIAALWMSGREAVVAAAQPSAATAFATCRDRLARAPDDYESAYCVYEAARDRRAWDDGAREFAALIAETPDNFWLPLAFGHLARNRQPGADIVVAERRYREAAAGFAALGHAEGEMLARSNLRDILVPRGRVAEATVEVSRVVALGQAQQDPILQARAWSLEAAHLLETGGDLGHAYRLLRQTERAVFPNGPYRLRRTGLVSLGIVAMRLGRIDEALGLFRRLDAIAAAEHDLPTQASARYNLLNTQALRETHLPSEGGRTRLLALARQSLETAEAAANGLVILKSHRALAALLANVDGRHTDALDHAERCLDMAAQAGQRQDEAACAWQVAELTHRHRPGRARAAQQRALDATALANNPVADAQNVGRHMRFSWETRSRVEAIADGLAALDTLETLRAMQGASTSRAEAFANWTVDYYWLAGRLLEDEPSRDPALAFSIAERLRARTLLEARERVRTPPDASDPAVAAQQATRGKIVTLQRALMDPSAGVEERARQLAALGVLEAQLAETDRALASTPDTTPGTPQFADLAAVQAALEPDEALLSYQLGLWQTADGEFGGGAWLLAVTSTGRRVYRLPDRVHFAPVVPVFAGLLSRADGVERVAAARLHADVFAGALGDLPASVTRLVIVADGPLHQLPFEALREQVEAPPLATTYEITQSPSATLWLAARRGRRPASGVLILADPDTEVSSDQAAADRQVWPERGVRLGRLPHARRESRAATRHLDGVETRLGSQASERDLKARDLTRYGALHFAAHAVADEDAPERSAVFLAAGGDDEDGLLQAREIAELDLAGKVVILSACRTASGAVISGEGVLSLARAFFVAGARAVVGTRWPVKDADAGAFFEMFYEQLGQGQDVSAALTAAKREAIERGMSAAIWSGVVLMGEGAVGPFAPRAAPPVFPRVMPGVVVAVALGGLLLALRARARAAV